MRDDAVLDGLQLSNSAILGVYRKPTNIAVVTRYYINIINIL